MAKEIGGGGLREARVYWGLVKQSAGCVGHESGRCSSQETKNRDHYRPWLKAATRSVRLIAAPSSAGRRNGVRSG